MGNIFVSSLQQIVYKINKFVNLLNIHGFATKAQKS
jgi:hypothetical protein